MPYYIDKTIISKDKQKVFRKKSSFNYFIGMGQQKKIATKLSLQIQAFPLKKYNPSKKKAREKSP